MNFFNQIIRNVLVIPKTFHANRFNKTKKDNVTRLKYMNINLLGKQIV